MIAGIPTSADVVVIGGGAVGTSTLYHLARLGCTQTVLIEKGLLGSGSTGAAAGGIRTQFSDELNIRIGLEAVRRFARFEEEIGAQIDFRQWGYLFLLSPEDLPGFERSVALQGSLGVPSRLITLADVDAIVPGLNHEGLVGATFCPLDGYANPASVVQGYAAAATRLHARVVQNCPVLDIRTTNGHIEGVETDQGMIKTSCVICTAGVWSAELLERVGIEMPVIAERRYVFVTEPGDLLPHDLPLTIDFATGFYFHREGRDQLVMGGPVRSVDELAPLVLRRAPALTDVGIRGGWSGDYEMSPDRNGIVGEAQMPSRLLYATGFSGHGFQQSPIVGEYLAHCALGLGPPLDLSPLSLERFRFDTLRVEENVV